jgi:hypothetical protein
MTDDEVIEATRAEGVELGWRFVNGKPVVGFTRGDDTRFPLSMRNAFRFFRMWPTGYDAVA